MQQIVNAAPTAGEGDRVRRMISALITAGVDAGYLVNSRLAKVHWQAGDRALPPPSVMVAGESAQWVDPAEIPSDDDVAKLGRFLAAGTYGRRGELMANAAAYSGLRWDELMALTVHGSFSRLPEIRHDPVAQVDAVGLTPQEVRDWLAGLPIGRQAVARVAWVADRLGASMSFGTFTENVDDLWFPAMDDVVSVLQCGSQFMVLVLDHEELITLSSVNPGPRSGAGRGRCAALSTTSPPGRTAIWLMSRPQQPDFIRGLLHFAKTGGITQNLKTQLRNYARRR
jgi:hypothetical protein